VKIVHVVTRGDVLGGAQSHVRELSIELLRLGHEVTVITGSPGVFSEQLSQAGIPWLAIRRMVRPVNPVLDLAALAELWLVLGRLQPDLVCAHTAKAGSLARAAARLRHIPSVFTPHGWSFLDRSSLTPRMFFCYVERLASRLGGRVINVCAYEQELARRFGISTRALEVVHNGIAEAGFARMRPIDAQPPVMVMVARFTAQKDHVTLLRAVSGLLSMEWHLQLLGGGELESRVRAQVGTLGLGGRVQILPPETDVNRVLMKAQLFVLSSQFEALPISILEAMRAGLPVVASDAGGVAECVKHEETGVLVGRGDVAGLRDALARMIADPALRDRLGEAGSRLWRAQFTAPSMTARTVEVYQRALASSPGRRMGARRFLLGRSKGFYR
jgi:glycosyltransferase involved in cell wall biosynthesis